MYLQTYTGERSLFFLLGKIHSAWSALYSTTDSGRIAHLTTTIKIYDTLLRSQSARDRVFDSPHDDTGMSGAFSVITRSLGLSKEREEKDDIPMSMSDKDKDNVNSAELSVRYAVCLANLGETAMAVTYARKILQNPETRSNSQMLHLLALLTSSAGDDRKVKNSLSLVLYEQRMWMLCMMMFIQRSPCFNSFISILLRFSQNKYLLQYPYFFHLFPHLTYSKSTLTYARTHFLF